MFDNDMMSEKEFDEFIVANSANKSDVRAAQLRLRPKWFAGLRRVLAATLIASSTLISL